MARPTIHLPESDPGVSIVCARIEPLCGAGLNRGDSIMLSQRSTAATCPDCLAIRSGKPKPKRRRPAKALTVECPTCGVKAGRECSILPVEEPTVKRFHFMRVASIRHINSTLKRTGRKPFGPPRGL